jgi:DNA-binding MarR family transcriptional regulator
VIAVEHELTVLARKVAAFSGQIARAFHPDLEPGAYALLLWLDDRGPSRLTEMAAFFGVGKPTISRQLQLLDRLDLITRKVDGNDRRAQVLTLSAVGADRMRTVREARRHEFRSLFLDWPQDDVHQLGDLLRRLNHSIGSPTHGSTLRLIDAVEDLPPADAELATDLDGRHADG